MQVAAAGSVKVEAFTEAKRQIIMLHTQCAAACWATFAPSHSDASG